MVSFTLHLVFLISIFIFGLILEFECYICFDTLVPSQNFNATNLTLIVLNFD